MATRVTAEGAGRVPNGAEAAHPKLFLNRELSWLEFNARVLEEARDPAVPLAERLKFSCIVSSNLDEFFMVRVAGLKRALAGHVVETGPDGMTPLEQLEGIAQRAHAMVSDQYRSFREDLAPGLAEKAGIRILRPAELSVVQKARVDAYFSNDVWPVLTPLAVDQGHPFPVLRNRSLNLAILLHKERQRVARRQTIFAVVQVPSVLPRLVEVPSEAPARASFVLLEDVIAMHVGDLFPGFRVVDVAPFRVTRNFDLAIDEDVADDLLKTIQKELRRRERNQPVRLEIARNASDDILKFFIQALRLEQNDVYKIDGPLYLADLMALYSREELRDLKDEAFSPQLVPPLQAATDIFRVIAERDVVLHHPYEGFDHVVDLISEAADDPNVLAIKLTLYRTSADSAIVRALVRAAENNKQVTAVVELRARFDETTNIAWARLLEEAGVHVVYGLPGLKTHCKMCLVVRREGGRIRRYVHLGTGNYNPNTARTYEDLSYFTAREAFADDVGALFNLLTGYSAPPSWKRFSVAPLGLHERILELIAREESFGENGRIIAKMNALVDPAVISALYRASQAGVQMDLIVRGICCLRPGVPGTSETIRVASIVDRFLEHARIFYFGAGGRREIYLSSADWMPRNFERRIEVMFPVEDEALKERLVDEILALMLTDTAKARRLSGDGMYARAQQLSRGDGSGALRSQHSFIDLARSRAHAPAPTSIDGDRSGPRPVTPARPPGTIPLPGLTTPETTSGGTAGPVAAGAPLVAAATGRLVS